MCSAPPGARGCNRPVPPAGWNYLAIVRETTALQLPHWPRGQFYLQHTPPHSSLKHLIDGREPTKSARGDQAPGDHPGFECGSRISHANRVVSPVGQRCYPQHCAVCSEVAPGHTHAEAQKSFDLSPYENRSLGYREGKNPFGDSASPGRAARLSRLLRASDCCLALMWLSFSPSRLSEIAEACHRSGAARHRPAAPHARHVE